MVDPSRSSGTQGISVGTSHVLALSNIWFSYDGKKYALKGIDLVVKPNSITIIAGPSGSGKTTLLKLVNGLIVPQRGLVQVLGVQLNDNDSRRYVRQRIGYIPQQLGLIRNRTALENVLIGALPRIDSISSLLGVFQRTETDHAQQCLDLVGIGHKSKEKVHRLSGGERQRVAIARALMQRSSLILADEFISDLDYVTAHEIMELISDIRRQGVSIVMALHDINIACEYGDTFVILKLGEKTRELHGNELNLDMIQRAFT